MAANAPRILVVDDSSSARLYVRSVLHQMGLTTVEACNGQEGLDKALAEPFDLVITDVEMPLMDGLTLCARLKDNSSTSSLPVIILSTRGTEEDIETGFSIGASAYVPKNKVADLPEHVTALLGKRSFLKDLLVLVVDDSRPIRDSVARDLRREGFQARTASDGLEALQLLDSGLRPDIIVTDLDMPRMDGLQFLSAINCEERRLHIPAVAMSAASGRCAMLQAVHAGAVAYIAKPFRVEQLAILLERLLSDQVQVLMEERKRLEMEQRLLLAAMSSLVNALEARDTYTHGHSEAVARHAVAIGKAMRMEGPKLERLKLAARLHDIGKIGVRDDVLLKPGRLTDEEFAHVKTHTTIAEDILRPIPSVQDIIEAASCHHERWDGSGYPRELSGKDIPLLARIIAVADVYDALTSHRPYRPAMPADKAAAIIRDGRGSHFCPDCADAFPQSLPR